MLVLSTEDSLRVALREDMKENLARRGDRKRSSLRKRGYQLTRKVPRETSFLRLFAVYIHWSKAKRKQSEVSQSTASRLRAMALIIVSGFPCSGRSTRVTELVSDFERRIASTSSAPVARIQVISDASVHNAKSCYKSQQAEKPARASYLSAVTRAIAKDCITVADGGAGLNIKGFRYQLWCAAREEGVRCVSVQVHAPPDVCKRWNKERRERGEGSYEEETMEEMLMV
jgi:Chromatin associated protein KTI12